MKERLYTIWEAALRMVYRPAEDGRHQRLLDAISRADDARGERDRAGVQFADAINDISERLR